MSADWVKDMNEMHAKYGVHEWVKNNQDEYKLAADGEMISVQDLSVERAIELWTSQ